MGREGAGKRGCPLSERRERTLLATALDKTRPGDPGARSRTGRTETTSASLQKQQPCYYHCRTRLGRYGKPLERSAFAVLSAVAEAPPGRVGASALYDVYQAARGRGAGEPEFDELLADLECDWYLTLDPRTGEYYFLVDVMRDWWRRWFGPARRRRPREQ